MSAQILLVISISIKLINCFYLEAESNYLKPKLERNNIVNKGIWVRNKLQQDLFEKSNVGNFIFRENSVDVDNVVQNNYDAFGDNAMQETPFVSNYVQRTRRSPEHIRKRRPRKSMKTKTIKNSIEDSVTIKSKVLSALKPTSVFNEYPYEVAILLDDPKNITLNTEYNEMKVNDTIMQTKSNNTDANEEAELKVIPLNPKATTDVPKRSKKNDRVTVDVTNYNIVQEFNKTDSVTDTSKQGRDIHHKDDKLWTFSAPVPDSNIYKIVPKEPEKSRSLTERGLIKIISMLTKTFKKIMKQHAEISNIHENLTDLGQVFDRKIIDLTTKFEDFDSKYSDMIQFNDKIKALEAKLSSQTDYCEIKQKDIQNTFTEFQKQQKKFLAQQRQFYGIQKLMLSQNEKINAKQNIIAKTQGEISHRQNNFARILKKAKQIIAENRDKNKHADIKTNNKYKPSIEATTLPIVSTTAVPPNTQAMTINLFSIPIKTKLENQDALIIKEKDQKQIDDLVYKFYFNNTFIDNLMKTKILNKYATNINSVEIVSSSNVSKNKRDELETTIMLPVNNSLSETPVKRERRWINHFSKTKYKKLNRNRKETTTILNSKEVKSNKIHDNTIHNELKIHKDQTLNKVQHDKAKGDAFVRMATNFCNEIGQNVDQVLKWCVEKALRRLKFMEMNAFTPPPVTVMKETKPQLMVKVSTTEGMKRNRAAEITTLKAVTPLVLMTKTRAPSTTLEPVVTSMYAVSTKGTAQDIFFPDNDELESNLKQFDLKPDTEGNVYYEGSLHISDFGKLPSTASEGTSDIMPGLMDSNSRVDIDPLAFDLQAKRRAFVRRLNENIMKQMRGG